MTLRFLRRMLVPAIVAALMAGPLAGTAAAQDDKVYPLNELTNPPKLTSSALAARLIAESYPADLKNRGVGGMVELQFVVDSKGKQRTAFTRLGSVSIPASPGSTSSYGVYTDLTLLDPTTARTLRDEINAEKTTKRIIAYIKTFGHTVGGNSFESTEYQFPIEVCLGCLVQFPSAANDPALEVVCGKKNCSLVSTTTTTASVSSVMPRAARWREPKDLSTIF